jgi:hypothetical protein
LHLRANFSDMRWIDVPYAPGKMIFPTRGQADEARLEGWSALWTLESADD